MEGGGLMKCRECHEPVDECAVCKSVACDRPLCWSCAFEVAEELGKSLKRAGVL
jgi:hypothetical protein